MLFFRLLSIAGILRKTSVPDETRYDRPFTRNINGAPRVAYNNPQRELPRTTDPARIIEKKEFAYTNFSRETISGITELIAGLKKAAQIPFAIPTMKTIHA